jgi:hypothetical protein
MGYIGNQTSNSYTSITKQDITGDGGTGYTLDHAVANAQEIEVFVNNVRQEPGVAYTVSGTTLTMTGNVAASDDFYVVFQGKAVQTTVPPDDSVTTARINDGAVTTDKIADDAVTAAKVSFALGKVVQVVSNNIETSLEVGSGGTFDWSEGATTITPTNTTNPILVLVNAHSKSTTSATRGNAKLRRKTNSGSYSDISDAYFIYNEFGQTIANQQSLTLMQWDNPSRSAGDSLTYTLSLARASGSDSVFLVGSSNSTSNITLVEFDGTTETDGA